ncbi:MAG: metal ABC transporter ATP-binding protein [Alphaproteobacteria bacterium]|nr:metal ABC transporter ATP-binding protein [Alphaproteobacteria bacterium]
MSSTPPSSAAPSLTLPASAPGPLISAAGLGVRLGDHWPIRGIDLDLVAGQVVTVMGPNGAGKTTLIRAILGLIAADEGRVERRADLTVGYVPQRLVIDRVLPLTVRRLMTLTKRVPVAKIHDALAMTGVADRLDTPVQGLSGGEFQRVLLARAIAAEPDLLVLDEPVQGVDYAGEAALYALIAEIRDRLGCGILMVSHDLHVVMSATDRVVCLNGHICCSGAPKDVAGHPEYRRLFGPDAGAFAVYEHHHDHDHDLDGSVIGGPEHHDHHHH